MAEESDCMVAFSNTRISSIHVQHDGTQAQLFVAVSWRDLSQDCVTESCTLGTMLSAGQGG